MIKKEWTEGALQSCDELRERIEAGEIVSFVAVCLKRNSQVATIAFADPGWAKEALVRAAAEVPVEEAS